MVISSFFNLWLLLVCVYVCACTYTCTCACVCLSIYMEVRGHIQELVLFLYHVAESEIRSSSLVASALITKLSVQLKVGIFSKAAISNSSLQDMGFPPTVFLIIYAYWFLFSAIREGRIYCGSQVGDKVSMMAGTEEVLIILHLQKAEKDKWYALLSFSSLSKNPKKVSHTPRLGLPTQLI